MIANYESIVQHENIARLSHLLEEAEKYLAGLDLGVSATVSLGAVNGHQVELHFKRHKDKWGLHATGYGDAVPLASAPKSIRIAASRALDALEAEMRAAKVRADNEILVATHAVSEFLRARGLTP